MLKKTELISEVTLYHKSLIMNKKYANAYLCLTILLLLLSSTSLILIYVDYKSEIPIFSSPISHHAPTAWTFIISMLLSFTSLFVFVPVTSVWYFKIHNRIQGHMPFILNTKIIDTCAFIVGGFDLITAILAALSPIIFGRIEEDYAWYADTKVILYVIMTSVIFFIWAILIPLLQDKVIEKDNEYFSQYSFFDHTKVNVYLRYLKKIYPKRVKQFNTNIKDKINLNDIRFTPVHNDEPFSYDTRRVFKNHNSKYGNEWYLIKYCLFIEIYSTILKEMHEDKISLKENINKFMKNRDKKKNTEFNNHLLKLIKNKIKKESN